MVEPSKTTDVTFAVPAELVTRAMDADTAETTALYAAMDDRTGDNERALAVARRELADAYDELARPFARYPVLFHALRGYAHALQERATEDEKFATRLDSRTGGEQS